MIRACSHCCINSFPNRRFLGRYRILNCSMVYGVEGHRSRVKRTEMFETAIECLILKSSMALFDG